MSAIDRALHARQLLLAEIGEHGQARLCATAARIPADADPHAAEIARDYLTRAGLHVLPTQPTSALVPAPTHEVIAPIPTPAAVATLAGRPELEHAAAALAGAFAAVEAIKAALGLPRAALPAALSLGGAPSP